MNGQHNKKEGILFRHLLNTNPVFCKLRGLAKII